MEDTDAILIINPVEDIEKLKALASKPRVEILSLIRQEPLNINEIADRLDFPQSTVATHISILEEAGLIETKSIKARKGTQKLCQPSFKELLIQFPDAKPAKESECVEIDMPLGIFTDYHVTAPCGLCSSDKIIGMLDTPEAFLTPDRIKVGLLWCTSGTVEYKFPNNTIYDERKVTKLEVSAELSSETPGTNPDWKSDITLWINRVEVGTWTSPGDFGDKRGKFTPEWWKLEGSQYGILKHFSVTDQGSFVDGEKVSDTTLADLKLSEHHSIRVTLGVKENAEHMGGMNIFGKGFGNYDQGLVLRTYY